MAASPDTRCFQDHSKECQEVALIAQQIFWSFFFSGWFGAASEN